MAFQPDQNYEVRISGVVAKEDNDGNPEFHLICREPGKEQTLPYKLKLRTKEQVVKARDVVTSFGIDTKSLASAAYIESALEASLMDRPAFIRTAAWEMNGKTGVYVQRISPTPFEAPSALIAKKFAKLAGIATPTSTPAAEIDDDDLPF